MVYNDIHRLCLIPAGTVKKLLRQIEQEHAIRVDEAKIEFPISSADSVRFLELLNISLCALLLCYR